MNALARRCAALAAAAFVLEVPGRVRAQDSTDAMRRTTAMRKLDVWVGEVMLARR